ncbi:MAG: hypothetical protein KAQ85_04995 [Thermodesulfovibrionia bacterium]|nr:hypothetical protein [Thermodesulfovibrionia bacterium]
MKYSIGTKITRKNSDIPVSWSITSYTCSGYPRGDGLIMGTYACHLDPQWDDQPFKRAPLFLYEDYMELQFNIHQDHFNKELFTLD